MAQAEDHDMTAEDEYDEEADSDFEAAGSGAEDLSSASESEKPDDAAESSRPQKRRKLAQPPKQLIPELDSGDEATIREQKKTRKKGTTKAEGVVGYADDSEEWRARTRAMRIKDKEERKKNKLASSKTSTIDVEKIWQEMNNPEPLPPPRIEGDTEDQNSKPKETNHPTSVELMTKDRGKENVPESETGETITIKRTYKFAGEVHVEEKTVLRSSAEAKLWLSQQQTSKSTSQAADGRTVNRPLRKISRFDPNFSNINAFKASWTAGDSKQAHFKGPKLNVVEKSKMDWAAHVDTEGLKEELDVHAKAKEGYLTRMDFLKEVEERKEAEAKAARLRRH